MAEAATLTIRLPAAVQAQLEAMALATGRDAIDLVAEAVRQYLDVETWHAAEITRALAEADAGDFATPEEIEAAFHRWSPRPSR